MKIIKATIKKHPEFVARFQVSDPQLLRSKNKMAYLAMRLRKELLCLFANSKKGENFVKLEIIDERKRALE